MVADGGDVAERASDEVVYAEWEDGRGNRNRVTSQLYKGKRVLHLRRYWLPDGVSDWIPTRVGVMIRSEQEFVEVLAGLTAAGKELGW